VSKRRGEGGKGVRKGFAGMGEAVLARLLLRSENLGLSAVEMH
jgi:hypothetical protein